ncbi:MAG: EF-P lysine aminoacylase EpmA [Pseudomarimonas sp.]
MNTDHDSHWRPAATMATLRLRAKLNALVRDHFAHTAALEVETPMLSQAGNTDPNIASFSLLFSGPTTAGASQRWLRTSPEFALKRLLAAGVGDCYELGRVFRDGEAGGRHNPEFSMLEWYRIGWDDQRLMAEAAQLVMAALGLVGKSARVEQVSYRQLFITALALDPMTASLDELRDRATSIHIDPVGLTRDAWLDLLLTHLIQPHFANDQLLMLHDYPASQCALAKIRGKGVDAVAERFEVFLGPLELANGYHELTDAAEQRRRFERDLDTRQVRGTPAPAMDERLLAALKSGLPACSGVALGMDRLLAAMLDSNEIASTLAFPFARA